eukprot:1409997-Pleurochrysis_carterae.AAC.3
MFNGQHCSSSQNTAVECTHQMIDGNHPHIEAIIAAFTSTVSPRACSTGFGAAGAHAAILSKPPRSGSAEAGRCAWSRYRRRRPSEKIGSRGIQYGTIYPVHAEDHDDTIH